MKKGKRIISVLLAVVMLLTAAPLQGLMGLEISDFGTTAKAAGVSGYNAAAAVAWARSRVGESVSCLFGTRYWYDGGDCANFVSECMYMGGLDPNPSWNHNGYLAHFGTESNGSWIRAIGLHDYAVSIGGQEIRNPQSWQCEPGDLIFYKKTAQGGFSHSAIVVGNDGGTVEVAAHSVDQIAYIKRDLHLGFADDCTYLVKMHGAKCTEQTVRDFDVYTVVGSPYLYEYASTGSKIVSRYISNEYTHVYNVQNVNGTAWGQTFRYGRWGWVKLASLSYRGHYSTGPINHKFGDWYVKVQPTCSTKGIEERICSICACVEQKEMSMGGAHMDVVPATCLNPRYCRACGEIIAPALGHNFYPWEYDKAPTCLEDGTEKRVCERCGVEENGDCAALGHNYEALTDLPNCIIEGSTSYKCTRCGDSYVEVSDWTGYSAINTSDAKYAEFLKNSDLYRTRQEYSYRTKLTTTMTNTTGTAPSVNGYTLENTSSGWNNYNEWSGWIQGTKSGDDYCQVESKSEHVGYSLKSNVYRKSGNTYRYYTDFWLGDGSAGQSRLDKGYTSEYWQWEINRTASISEVDSATKVYYGQSSPKSPENYWGYNDVNKTGYWMPDNNGDYRIFFIDSNIYTQYYRYRERTKQYVYTYYKWGDWSSWSTTKKSEVGSNEQEQSRITYSFKSAALGHDWDTPVIVQPTCHENGYTRYTCKRCGLHMDTNITESLGDKWGEWYLVSNEGETPRVYRRDCVTNCGCNCGHYQTKIEDCIYSPINKVEPTCTTQGYTEYKCTLHGESKIEDYVDSLDHECDEIWVLTKAPTCTEEGVETAKCIRHDDGKTCDKTYTRPIRANGHDMQKMSYTAPTCIKEGNKEYYYCHDCCKYFADEKGEEKIKKDSWIITATGHNRLNKDGEETWITEVEAACGTTGRKDLYCRNEWCDYTAHCDNCNEDHHYLLEEIEIPEIKPDYFIFEHLDATCYTLGYDIWQCRNCLNTDHEHGWTDILSYTEHTWGEPAEVYATCTESGYKTYKCRVCHITDTIGTETATDHSTSPSDPNYNTSEDRMELISSDKNVCGDGTVDKYQCCHLDMNTGERCAYTEVLGEEKDHQLGDYIVTLEPTCTEVGYKHKECVNCDYTTKDEPIPPTGHDFRQTGNTKATCTEPAYEIYTCINIKCVLTYEEPVGQPLGHIYNQIVNDDNPDTHKIVCERDESHIKCREDHKWDDGKLTKAATCEKDGEMAYTCTICGYTRTEPIPAIGHDYGPWVDDENGISHTKTCQRDICDETVTEHKMAENHKMSETDRVEPTCTEDGYIEYTCSACGYTNKTPLDMIGHKYGDWEVVTHATCIAPGEKKRVCANDESHVETGVINLLDHDYVAVVTAPTCTTDGFTTHTCSFCGDSYTDSETNALGHAMGDNWYVYKEATYDEAGEKRNDCQRNCGYYENEPIHKLKYIITFVVNDGSSETVIKTVEYEKGAKSISVPSVPSKDGYVGFWEDYELNSAPKIKVKAVYESKSTDNTSELETEKKAVYDEKTGVASITLNAFADTYNVFSSELVGTPLDIVLVVDQSGSMGFNMDNDKNAANPNDSRRENLKKVASNFVNTVYDNAVSTGSDHRISVVGFAGADYSDLEYYYVNTGLLTPNAKLINYIDFNKKVHAITNEQYRDSLMSVLDSKDVILKAIDEIKSKGATAADLGLEMAANVFGNNKINTAERKRLVIFLTDGTPTYKSGFSSDVAENAVINANTLKNIYGATVYSIGITNDADPGDNKKDLNKFLHRVSSNYSNATTHENGSGNINDGYYIAATNTEALQNIFNNIYVRTVATTVSFDSVTFHDTISEYFTLTTEQENELRENLKNEYGLTADNITVIRHNDGTTTLEIRGVNTKKIYDSSNTMTGYGASIRFNVTANERALNAGIYNTNTDDAYLEIDGKKAAEFEVPNITISSPRNIVKFNIGDEIYAISQLHIGDAIVAPDIDYAHWNINENEVVTKSFTEFNATLDSSDRYISWIIGDEVILQSYKVGQVITAPEVKSNGKYLFDGWNSEVPCRMPDVTRLSFTAVFKIHEHAFTDLVGTKGNCETGVTKTYACLCGATETYTLPVTKHTYEANIVNVDEKSVATFRCTLCGDTYDKTLTYTYRAGKRTTNYDLKLYNAEGISVQPDGTIQIRIPITAEMKANLNNKTPVVYRYENGKYVELTTTVEDNAYIVFTTDHFSTYVLTADDVDTTAIGYEGIICEMEGHLYAETTVAHTCEEDGYTVHTCSVCGDTYTDRIIKATGHEDNDSDGYCDNCSSEIKNSNPIGNCSHICHNKNSFVQFFYKIFRFFWKLFGINKYCQCSVAHY